MSDVLDEPTAVAATAKPSRSALGWAVLLVMVPQALIFFAFGAGLATHWTNEPTLDQFGRVTSQLVNRDLPFGLLFLGVGVVVFVVGLGASRGRRTPSMIGLLLEAGYITTKGTGTVSFRGYADVLNYPFWLALGFAAVAAALLAIPRLMTEDRRRQHGLTVAVILGLAASVGVAWQYWLDSLGA